MAEPYIRLQLNSLDLTIDSFVDEKYPRIPVNVATKRNAVNRAVLLGCAFEDPFLWDFTAFLTTDQSRYLDLIYSEHMRLRRTLQSNYRILLTDTTRPYSEVAPRTRAIADSTIESTLSSGFVSYNAKFWVSFESPIEHSADGRLTRSSLSLIEDGGKVAP